MIPTGNGERVYLVWLRQACERSDGWGSQITHSSRSLSHLANDDPNSSSEMLQALH